MNINNFYGNARSDREALSSILLKLCKFDIENISGDAEQRASQIVDSLVLSAIHEPAICNILDQIVTRERLCLQNNYDGHNKR